MKLIEFYKPKKSKDFMLILLNIFYIIKNDWTFYFLYKPNFTYTDPELELNYLNRTLIEYKKKFISIINI